MPVTHIPAIGADKQFPAHLTCNMQSGTEFFRYLFCHWHKTLLVLFVTTSLSLCSFWQPVQADSQPKSSGLVFGRRPLGAILHSSNEPGELLQWICHDDSTINMCLSYYYYQCRHGRYRYDTDISDPKYRRYQYPLLQRSFAYSYISLSPAK